MSNLFEYDSGAECYSATKVPFGNSTYLSASKATIMLTPSQCPSSIKAIPVQEKGFTDSRFSRCLGPAS